MVIPPAIAMAFQLGPNHFVTSYTGHTFHHPVHDLCLAPCWRASWRFWNQQLLRRCQTGGSRTALCHGTFSYTVFQAHVLRWLYDFYHRPSDERLEVPHITQDALGGIVNKLIPIILKMTASAREIDCDWCRFLCNWIKGWMYKLLSTKGKWGPEAGI